MNILITGSNGQLGQEILQIEANHPHTFFYTRKEDLDITDENAVSDYIGKNDIEVIINAAAYTAVDKAESEEKLAFLVNHKGPQNLAKAAKQNNAFLVHISTDYVFDGQGTAPYNEDHITKPLGVYGRSKRAGEEAILAEAPHSVIVRTSWLYSRFGKNFVKTMLHLGEKRDELNVVNDQIGCPTFAGDLAEAIMHIVEQKGKISQPEILHYSNQGKCSWYDFADFIMKEGGLNCTIHPIPTKDYPTPAQRPAYSLMSTKKIKEKFNVAVPEWKKSAAFVINHLLSKTENMEAIPVEPIIEISIKAGAAILEIYKRDFKIEDKEDKSPLTEADLAANAVIVDGLEKHFSEIPIMSEETKQAPYSERKNWTLSWCVDPLDGTKEFIKRNGEFTVNIALISEGQPILGVIYVPVTDTVYYAKKYQGAFKIAKGKTTKLQIKERDTKKGQLVASRSHLNDETKAFVEKQKEVFDEIELVPAGSSLKFCLVAEGNADIYPRLAPTMEWDTAAGQIIAEEAGAEVIVYETGKPLTYNREQLRNPMFVVRPRL